MKTDIIWDLFIFNTITSHRKDSVFPLKACFYLQTIKYVYIECIDVYIELHAKTLCETHKQATSGKTTIKIGGHAKMIYNTDSDFSIISILKCKNA